MAEVAQTVQTGSVAAAAEVSQAGAKVMTGRDRREELTKEEIRRRKRKNWALCAVLVAFVALVYFVSIVRMSMNTP